MKRASFISYEDEDLDLILSFALEDKNVGLRSLILSRSPRSEKHLPKEEHGVRVSLEGHVDYGDDDLLVQVVIAAKHIDITTRHETYNIDLSKVDDEEMQELLPFLQKMNFDSKFNVVHA